MLIDYIRDYRRYGADSGVFVSCDCDCRTLDNEDWERQLEEITGSIVILLMKVIAFYLHRGLQSLYSNLIIIL